MLTERKRARRAVEEWFDGPVHSLLAQSGFVQAEEAVSAQEPMQMFRSLAQKIEVVGCRIAQRAGVEETELYVETGVFLRDVPHYLGIKFSGFENVSLKSTLDCHFRQNLKPSWTLGSPLSRRTTWLIKGSNSNLEGSLADALRKLETTGLAWFERYSDLGVAYHALLQKRSPGPNLPDDWGQVYGEILVKGFLGLERQDWATAVACLEEALALTNPHHSIDPSKPERLYHQIEPEIVAALAKARAEIRQ